MTPDERAALRALADAATPGPWESSYNITEDTYDVSVLYSNGIGVVIAKMRRRGDDSSFIAAARAAVPALLDALDAAEAEVEGQTLVARQFERERDAARAALDRVRAECAEYVEWLHEDHGTPETWPTGTVHTALVPVPEILRAIEGES